MYQIFIVMLNVKYVERYVFYCYAECHFVVVQNVTLLNVAFFKFIVMQSVVPPKNGT